MDVVYIVGPGDDNEELRYSLRSLRHLPHDRVWIAGYTPRWVAGVSSIPVKQGRDKYRNSVANVRAALETEEVSDPFVYMNDDFFVLRPVEGPPSFHRGPLETFLAAQKARRRIAESSYAGGRRDTARLLAELGISEPLAFEPLHTPMLVRKDRMSEALRVGEGVAALHYRTLYGNLAGGEGTIHPNVKISDQVGVPRREWDFVSTNARAFARGRVGQLLRDLFPDASDFEGSYEPHQPRPVRHPRRSRLRRREPGRH